MMATGSPGASRKRKNTNTATTTMTGMVANRRRRINALMCSPARSLPSRCLSPCGACLHCDATTANRQGPAPPRAPGPHPGGPRGRRGGQTLFLRNVPEHDETGVGHNTVQPVGAIGEHGVPLPERNIDHLVHGARLQLASDLGLLLVLLGKRVVVSQPLDLGIAGPTEQALVAGGPDPSVQDGVRRADAAGRGDEDVPAALC